MGKNSHSPVLRALAALYSSSEAGRTGRGEIDFQPDIKKLLRAARSEDGEARSKAVRDLQHAEAQGLVRVQTHSRDREIIEKVRLPLAKEAEFFASLGELSPTELRQNLACQFAGAAEAEVTERWREVWRAWCERMRRTVIAGGSVAPFDREPSAANHELLSLLPKLLAWEGESLVRFVSCVLCGDSKKLGALTNLEREGEFAGQLRGKLGNLLNQITNGEICSLNDLGILPNPRFALVHGPLRLRLDGEWLDLGQLHGPFRLSRNDIERAQQLATTARRCLTVENETSFHELAKLRSGELLIQTSYPGSGTLALLRRLPATLEFWHFGDTDEDGFDILRVLREKSGCDFKPLHMERGCASFEQESLGRPKYPHWPFY